MRNRTKVTHESLVRGLEDTGKLIREGQHSLALEQLDDLVPEAQRDAVRAPAYWLQRFSVLHAVGRLREAREALSRVPVERVPPGAALRLERAERQRDGDVEGQIRVLEKLVDRGGSAPDHEVLARLRRSTGDLEGAERAARASLEVDPNRPGAWVELFAASREGTNEMSHLAAIVRDAAVACATFPPFPRPNLLFLLTALPRGEARDLGKVVADAGLGSSYFDRLLRQVIDDLHENRVVMSSGAAEGAVAASGSGDSSGPRSPGGMTYRAIIEALPGGKPRRSTVIDNGSALVSSGPSLTGTTLVYFQGFGGGSADQVAVMEAFCAAAGHAAIYLRDRSFRFFLDGVPGASDGPEPRADELRERLVALGTKRLIAWGPSAGGFAAIRYGLMLGADLIVGMSSVTTGAPATVRAMGEPRAAGVVEYLERVYGAERLDVLPELERNAGKVREGVHLWYAAENRPDAAQARRVGHVEGVTLHALEDHASHNLASRLIPDGTFAKLLR